MKRNFVLLFYAIACTIVPSLFFFFMSEMSTFVFCILFSILFVGIFCFGIFFAEQKDCWSWYEIKKFKKIEILDTLPTKTQLDEVLAVVEIEDFGITLVSIPVREDFRPKTCDRYIKTKKGLERLGD